MSATFFIALFNLALPVFVINVLNRYIGYGFDGTLITLTSGMVIAVFLQFGFRIARTKMLGAVSAEPDTRLAEKTLNTLVGARIGALERIPPPRLQETINGLQSVNVAYDAAAFTAILDAPFSLLYILATFFLSPILAFIAMGGILSALAAGAFSLVNTRETARSLQDQMTSHRGQIDSAIDNSSTVRAFEGQPLLTRIWERQIKKITALRLQLADRKERSQSVILTLGLLMNVVLYTVGAVFVVSGNMTVGALIGANILASRAFQNVVRFVQTSYLIRKGHEAESKLQAFMTLPMEPNRGTALKQYKGGLRFKDLGFAYAGASGPLYESLNLNLTPGSVLIVTGKNGTGKTTLARLIIGLLIPSRGDILLDGISLRQVSPAWWRRQVIYFPQEPSFFNTTIRENLSLVYAVNNASPPLEKELNRVIKAADLRTFLDRAPQGFDTPITNGGRHLALGIRRRLALARALMSNGMLAILDEPTEGLDADGCSAVYAIMNEMSKAEKTIIAFAHDPLIVKGANYRIDLNRKPVPKITRENQENPLISKR